MDRLTGIHAVKEALEAQRPIERIAIAKGRQDTRVEEIVPPPAQPLPGGPSNWPAGRAARDLRTAPELLACAQAARFLRPACPAAPLLWRCARSAAALQALP